MSRLPPNSCRHFADPTFFIQQYEMLHRKKEETPRMCRKRSGIRESPIRCSRKNPARRLLLEATAAWSCRTTLCWAAAGACSWQIGNMWAFFAGE